MPHPNEELSRRAVTDMLRTLQVSKSTNRAAQKRLSIYSKDLKRLAENAPDLLTKKRQKVLKDKHRLMLVALRKDLRQIVMTDALLIGKNMADRQFLAFAKVLDPSVKINKAVTAEVVKLINKVDIAGKGNIKKSIGGYINYVDSKFDSAMRINASNKLGNAAFVSAVAGNNPASVKMWAKKGLATISRTSINAASAAGRVAWAENNSNLVKGVKIVATLDNRTTVICADLDGRIFAVGERQPPFHMNCRTTLIFVLKDNVKLRGGKRASKYGQVSEKMTWKKYMTHEIKNNPKGVIKSYGKTRGSLLIKNGASEIHKFVDGDLLPKTISQISK